MKNRALYAAVGLTAGTLLGQELLLHRLLSVVFFDVFALAAVSLSLLGLGVGALLARPESRVAALPDRVWALIGGSSALALVLLLTRWESLQHYWLQYFSLGETQSSRSYFSIAGKLAIVAAFAIPPFVAKGYFLARAYRSASAQIGRLYFIDMVAGGLVCIAYGALFSRVPAQHLFLLLEAIFVAYVFLSSRRILAIIGAIFALLVWDATATHPKLQYRFVETYDLEARWSLLGLTTVGVEENGLYVSLVNNVSPSYWVVGSPDQYPRFSPPRAVFATDTRPGRSVVDIASGAGSLLAFAADAGYEQRDGVDLAGDRLALLEKLVPAAELARVRAANSSFSELDGRAFLRNSKTQYDVVNLTENTLHSFSNLYSLSFSGDDLNTEEAFYTYFDHLRPGGVLVYTSYIGRDREGIFLTKLATLRRVWESRHKGTFADSALLTYLGTAVGGLSWGSVIVSGEPLPPERRLAIEQYLSAKAYRSISPPLPGARQIAGAHPGSAFLSDVGALLSPTPPLDKYARVHDGFPEAAREKGLGRFTSKTEKNRWIYLAILLLVVGTIAVLLFLRVAPSLATAAPFPQLAYFLCLGLGYMLVETLFLRNLTQWLGHVSYSTVVVLPAFLIGSGLGSLALATRFSRATRRSLALFVGGVGATAVVAYLLVANGLLDAFVGLPLVAKAILGALALFPLTFALGVPFGAGAARLREGNAFTAALAVNFFASVLAPILGMIFYYTGGYAVLTIAAAGAYCAAALCALRLPS